MRVAELLPLSPKIPAASFDPQIHSSIAALVQLHPSYKLAPLPPSHLPAPISISAPQRQAVCSRRSPRARGAAMDGSTTSDDQSIIPDWGSLLRELVQGIANRVVSTTVSTTGGVDAYMDMRAICRSWRTAISKPSPLAAVADLRFRPRHWLMLDMKSDASSTPPAAAADDARLFLHALTGRFRRLRLPALRGHILVGSTDGLLVLGDREPPHLARVLNPFTGDMLHFAAPLPEDFEDIDYTAVNTFTGSHSTSTLVLCKWDMILYADPTSHVFTEETATFSINLVTFQGNIYCADSDGWLYRCVAPPGQCDDVLVLIARVPSDVDVYTEENYGGPSSYLAESAAELLYIRHLGQGLKVLRVDIEHKLMEEVNSLGGCGHDALFLGRERCVSVDADKLPSVEAGCIYYMRSPTAYGEREWCVYNLREDKMEIIASDDHLERPFSLVQVLLRHCDFRWRL